METLGAALEREHREIDRAIDAFLDRSGEVGDRTESLLQALWALRPPPS